MPRLLSSPTSLAVPAGSLFGCKSIGWVPRNPKFSTRWFICNSGMIWDNRQLNDGIFEAFPCPDDSMSVRRIDFISIPFGGGEDWPPAKFFLPVFHLLDAHPLSSPGVRTHPQSERGFCNFQAKTHQSRRTSSVLTP